MTDFTRSHRAISPQTRRDLIKRGAALGAALPVLGAAGFGATPNARAQEEELELGTYDGQTLRVSISLQETEVSVFEDLIVGGFQERTGGAVELISIQAADVITSLAAQVSSGNLQIDLLTQDNNSLAPLVDQGLVEALPEAEEVIPEATIPALLEVLQFDGEYYFLPARPNVQITYYNERLFGEWGIEPPVTWEDLLAAAQAIQENAGIGKVSIQGAPGGPVGVTVTQFLWQAGGDPLQINTPEGVTAFEFMRQLQPYLTPQYRTAEFNTDNTYLLNESTVLAQNWPFGISVIVDDGGKEEIKTYPGWAGPEGEVHVLGGDVFGIVTGTPNRDMALDFAKFFMSREIQEQLTSQLSWPAIREDAFGAVEEWQQPYFESVLEALGMARARPNVTYWLQVEQVLSNAFNDIVTNGQEAQATLDRYQQEIDTLAAG